jgi:probable lipoprotein NlpC
MKLFFSAMLFFFASWIFAAPLEGGFALAPRASATPEEREQAYLNARHGVIEAAKKYEGTPYLYGGITSSGLDCSGLLYLSFRDAIGVSLPRSASGLFSWVERISFERAQPGDLLFFKTDSTGNITHVALYLGGRRFIHAASAGPVTGVIYSTLDDNYYARAYAGAGRAFPEAASSVNFNNSPSIANGSSGSSGGQVRTGRPNLSLDGGSGHLLFGAAFAPTWNGFLKDSAVVRGFSSQVCLFADTSFVGMRMIFGLELRPEYDGALGVFRLPITLSWGPSDKIRIFAGPVFSFGDASLSIDGAERRYSGGTSWLGTIGITIAPFVINSAAGDFAPYLEAAWQSYFSEDTDFNLNADFSASFRFSTGIRWTIRVF